LEKIEIGAAVHLSLHEFELRDLTFGLTRDETYVVESAVEFERFSRRSGDVLHPERESRETLETIKKSLGSYTFAARYQQSPTPPGGLMVKREWFSRYERRDLPESFDQIVMSCDTANKVSELSDFSVLTIWGVKESRFYLLHVLRRKMGYPELKRVVRETANQFQATTVLIEDHASGTQLIQELIY
jgi:hypothetical protein